MQTVTCRGYINELENLLNIVTGFLESNQISIFQSGLGDDIYIFVLSQRPITFSDAFEQSSMSYNTLIP